MKCSEDLVELTEKIMAKQEVWPDSKERKRSPRIGFEITPEQRDELKRLIPWGVVTSLYQAITEDLIELMRTHGSGQILSAVLSRQVKFYEISKTLKQDDSQ